MKALTARLPAASFVLFAAFLISMALRGNNETTTAIVISSLLMFVTCWASATHLLGARAALQFALIALSLGWFAEQMGASRGWFFGDYHYTDVLGWRLGEVPAIIPLMWFSLTYSGYVLANLIVWRSPVDGSPRLSDALGLSFLAAMIVTAFDLGADPYFVFRLKAWIMVKTDGGWFGETIQGFFGWVLVAFVIVLAFRLSLRRLPTLRTTHFARHHALVPLGIYGAFMVFQMALGSPIETRVVAAFAMGIPLLCALAGWRHWKAPNNAAAEPQSASWLEPMQFHADPTADDAMADIVGEWQPLPTDATLAQTLEQHATQWRRIGEVNQLLGQWTDNASLATWPGEGVGAEPEVVARLKTYLAAAHALPPWADPARIERAETLFMDYGALSCTLLFCSSLPECYVIPDLAAVLHVAGQLEQHTEYRIRTTAAMIFPVMMKGGLTTPDGGGIAQVLKVRLIHATIRHLILRGDPRQAAGRVVPPLVGMRGTPRMHHALFAHGWDTRADGLPCNQEELAYTLLTFGYVFLRSLRKLDLALSPADEEAYLHVWNVVGHVLGIQDALMAHTMAQAETLFAKLQARGRADVARENDPRPALGNALMQTMASVIPFRLLKPFPVLLTSKLCGSQTATDLGLDGRVSWVSRVLFLLGMGLTHIIDTVARLVWPEFSISRLITRVLGYHFVSQLLLSQTRPLQLPNHLLNRIDTAMDGWSDDPKAPAWMNRIEDLLTTQGRWKKRGGL